MKHIFDNRRIAGLFIKAGLIVALAAALLAPMTVSTNGGDAAPVFTSWNG